jgi:microcystin-dependent protein
VTLLESEMPVHSHAQLTHGQDPADLGSPSPNRALARTNRGFGYTAPGSFVPMSGNALAPAGGDQPHNNMQPYLTFFFCIALQGVFPPRT